MEMGRGVDGLRVLSVWQYATAASIFIGAFTVSDVRSLYHACRIIPS